MPETIRGGQVMRDGYSGWSRAADAYWDRVECIKAIFKDAVEEAPILKVQTDDCDVDDTAPLYEELYPELFERRPRIEECEEDAMEWRNARRRILSTREE
jgi:hypothetical protein